MIKSFLLSKSVRKVADIIVAPFTFLGSWWFRYIRSRNVNEMPVSKKIFQKIGVFPINDHYYEPLFNTAKHIHKRLDDDRKLQAIDFNINEQRGILSRFRYNEEITQFPLRSSEELTYYFNNGSYPAGDAELLYNMIRLYQPRKIIEIGCGFSTLMMQNALKKNLLEGKNCEHICIEPYEVKWLEKLNIQVERMKVESLNTGFFSNLEDGDVLFIDSTHVIRPQGDVLFEILEILPTLKKGVLVHFHDVFTPKDYPEYWVKDLNRFWNEQYLLEAFLSYNSQFKILLAANFLRHHYEPELLAKCPVLANQSLKEPGSLWIQKL
jgi:predicted O-methyltransferase YrrM